MHHTTVLSAFLALALLTAPAAAAAPVPDQVEFNRDVRPILSNYCFTCHGPDERHREADQRFDTEAGLQAAIEAEIIVPRSPEKSGLMARLLTSDPDLKMPPASHGKNPSARDVAILKKWIEQGARWQEHWAFIAPRRPELPQGGELDKVKHPIDRFVLRKILEAGLTPAAAADRQTLLRRLSLDLTGLPPSPELQGEFLADKSSGAYDKLVDRLLGSPAFGERLAIYWLDLVRYADSVGYHKDSHRNIWLYRDYVIAAFNANKPFDQFVREQLAGDLMARYADASVSETDKTEWRIASGFNRLNQTTTEGGAQAKEYLAKYAADRVRNTGAILLGITTGCAECHDHKYDPITAADFYRFEAFFADLQEGGVANPKEVQLPTIEHLLAVRDLERQIESLESRAAGEEDSAALETQIAGLAKDLAKLTAKPPTAPTIITDSGKPREIRILPRGDWLDGTGPVVEPAIPEQFGQLDIGDRRATRLDLANWVVDRNNPLTARVFVNRLWKLLFGRGISNTLDDLGAQGEWPTHPELLDWLAIEFIDSGWDVKHMVKLIVTSDAYRRASVVDAASMERDLDNRYFARQGRYRLDAEVIRDQALAASGLLSPKMYGRSVKPYQPANYWFRLYHQAKYEQDHGEDLYRRGVYTYWRRSFWHPELRAFDAPSREECVADRPRSNTPQQALVLLNDPTYVEAARVLAERMIEDGGANLPERVNYAYRRTLCRDAEAWEIDALTKLFDKHFARYSDDETSAAALISVGEAPVPKDIPPAELAAWTSIARAILNLHETITRN